MEPEIPAPVSFLSGRVLPLSVLYNCSPSSALPFPPLIARSRRRIRARAVLRSLRRRRRAPFRRRRRSGLPPHSATPPSASPCCRRPRPPLRFVRRLPEHRRPRQPEPRRRLPPLRFAAAVAPVFLPARRHLPRHRRTAVALVRASVSLADRRSAAVIVIPSRAAVFLRSVRRFRRLRCLGVSRGPSPSFPPSLLSLGRRSAAPMVAGGDHRGAGAPLPSAVPARPPSGA